MDYYDLTWSTTETVKLIEEDKPFTGNIFSEFSNISPLVLAKIRSYDQKLHITSFFADYHVWAWKLLQAVTPTTKFAWPSHWYFHAHDESDPVMFENQEVPLGCFTLLWDNSATWHKIEALPGTLSTPWVKNKVPKVNVRDRNYRNEEKIHLHLSKMSVAISVETLLWAEVTRPCKLKQRSFSWG